MVGKSVLILGINLAEVFYQLKSDIIWVYQASPVIAFAGVPWPRPFVFLLGPRIRVIVTVCPSARLLILGREHKHVLPRTGSELNHILVS